LSAGLRLIDRDNDQLRKHGVQAADNLPFACMAWFFVSAEGEKLKECRMWDNIFAGCLVYCGQKGAL